MHPGTAGPGNVPVYQHLGFAVDGRFRVPGLVVTAMGTPGGRPS